MLIDSAKIKLDNLLSNYQVYDSDWLDTLVRRLSSNNIYRELLEKCTNPKTHLEYYIDDPDIVHLLMLILTHHAYKFEEPYLTLDTGFIIDLTTSENTIVYPYLIINSDFAVNVESNEELFNYFKLSKNNGKLEFEEDPIPNSDIWKKLVNTTAINADASFDLLQSINTTQVTDIKSYYNHYISKTHIELHGDSISIFNGKDTFRVSTFELSPLDPNIGPYNMKWFGNDLWFYEGTEFKFALHRLDALKLFGLDSLTISSYTILNEKRILPCLEVPVVHSNYTQLLDGFIFPRNLFAHKLMDPRCVVSPFEFHKDDKSYIIYYSHNKIIAEVEVNNE